jgi:hypothetical protein
VHHALDDERVQLASAVVDHHVLPQGDLASAPVDQAAVRRVCEDELRADSPLTVDRPGQRVLVDVVHPEPGILPGR